MKTAFLLFSSVIFTSTTTQTNTQSLEEAYAIKVSWTQNLSAESDNCTAVLNFETNVFTGTQGCSLNVEILKGELNAQNKQQLELFPEQLKAYLASHFSKSIEEVQFKEIIFVGDSQFHSVTYTP